MPIFEIEQYEVHAMKYRVQADSEAEAIAKLLDGKAEAVEGSLEYIEICEDLGLPTDEYQEVTDELRALDVSVDEAIIPSIRSIMEIEETG